jgi:hypothetical protein
MGALALILPFIKGRYKEWAYAGFGFTMISAFVSHWAVDGFGGQTILPLVIFAILITSYRFYHKLSELPETTGDSLEQGKYIISGLHQ